MLQQHHEMTHHTRDNEVPKTYLSSILECNLDESEAFRFFVATGAVAAADAEELAPPPLVDSLLSFTNEPPPASGGNPPGPITPSPPLCSMYGYLGATSLAAVVARTDGARIEELGTDLLLLMLLPPPVEDLSDRL